MNPAAIGRAPSASEVGYCSFRRRCCARARLALDWSAKELTQLLGVLPTERQREQAAARKDESELSMQHNKLGRRRRWRSAALADGAKRGD